MRKGMCFWLVGGVDLPDPHQYRNKCECFLQCVFARESASTIALVSQALLCSCPPPLRIFRLREGASQQCLLISKQVRFTCRILLHHSSEPPKRGRKTGAA